MDGGTSRFDRNGVIYQAMCANCTEQCAISRNIRVSGHPTNHGHHQGGACNLGMLKIEMNFAGVRPAYSASIDGVPNDTIGCAPLSVHFSDTLSLGKRYYWDFGDGSGDTTITPPEFAFI